MAKELVPVDITNTPDMLRLAEEVATSRVPRVLRRDGEDLAVLVPVAPRPKRPSAQGEARSGLTRMRRATLGSTAGSLEPATRTEDIEVMIRDAKEEHAERTMAKLEI